MNSRDAPPPVETWVTWSATPAWATADGLALIARAFAADDCVFWWREGDGLVPWSTRASADADQAALGIAAESPPPTTVSASLLDASAWATATVPAAKRGFSNTPIGPFQNTVRARWTAPR